MDCPAEEAIIRARLGKMPGVSNLSFDLFNRRLRVEHALASDTAIVMALKGIGMVPEAGTGQTPHTAVANSGCESCACETSSDSIGADEGKQGNTTAVVRLGVYPTHSSSKPREHAMLTMSGLSAFCAELVAWITQAEHSYPVVALAVLSILLGGLPTLRKGLIAFKALTLNINFLMTVAVIGAAAVGSWSEAAMVVFLFSVAERIEAYSLDRARNAVRSLMTLTPDTASVKTDDGSWSTVSAASVAVGATVRVKPGDRVPLDGTITHGASAVDQAPITGESVPVDKGVGDQVFAGTINGNGLLEFKTTGGKDGTTLARIIKTVQEAQGQRAPTQRFVDSFARIYTPIVFILALLVAVVPPLVFAQPWHTWVYKALVLLVIACPCALVISTPVTIVSGLAAAAKRGILIKGGVYLEQGKAISAIALDKTGTITGGQPKLTDVMPLTDLTKDELLQLAASLDAGSDHPIARTITTAWTGALLPVDGFVSITGRGVSGRVNGHDHFVGNHRLTEERGLCGLSVEAALAILEAEGKTTIVVGNARGVLGVLAVADTPRKTSIEAIRSLHAMGVTTVMLTGDNQTTASAIAKTVGIDDARGNLLPEDKLRVIDELLGAHGAVGMVGDGINDAPALAKATVGFAMGAAGTDTALETADVALMKDDLRGVPEFLLLSRRVSAILIQNISIALGAKLVFFVLALLGVATMWMAVLADVGATLVVIANGLRVLRTAHCSIQVTRT